MANEFLASQNQSITDLNEKLKDGDPKGLENLFEIDLEARIKAKVERIIKQDNNIIGFIPSDNHNAEYIFIGAHYDHLGFGETNSRSVGEDKTKIHNGADDNGSGTVAVIELAEYFAGLRRDTPEAITENLVFCLWSGEELGLLGSNSFATNLPVPKERIKAYLNFDMVGRVKENKLEIQGLGSAEEWKSIIEKKNIIAGFDLTLSSDPYLPTDATSFYLQGIPVISFFSGVHQDYHTHKDDVEFINFEDLQRVAKLASLITHELMKPDQMLTYEEVKVKSRKGTRGAISISLGTIPAYAGSDEPGVQIQGVRPGGPAERAGLMANDIIVGLNGKEVNNIYDFMNMLNELKADVVTEIVVKRDGDMKAIKIIPEAKQ
jgi:membrane-associated protease RseP (regulator of RpoE activity)